MGIVNHILEELPVRLAETISQVKHTVSTALQNNCVIEKEEHSTFMQV